MPGYTFFLAHAGADTERAKELRNLLVPEISVFLDAFDLTPGENWDIELPLRQRQAKATVAMLSSATESAYYLREEIASAIAYHRQEPEKHRLIPVFLDGVPKDPLRIPYGVRQLHALDVNALGMSGVAGALRKIAAEVAGAPLPPTLTESPEPADRFTVYDALCVLLPVQFDEILFRTNAPKHQLAPASEPLARRALDLIQWSEQANSSHWQSLCAAIRKTAPGVLQ